MSRSYTTPAGEAHRAKVLTAGSVGRKTRRRETPLLDRCARLARLRPRARRVQGRPARAQPRAGAELPRAEPGRHRGRLEEDARQRPADHADQARGAAEAQGRGQADGDGPGLVRRSDQGQVVARGRHQGPPRGQANHRHDRDRSRQPRVQAVRRQGADHRRELRRPRPRHPPVEDARGRPGRRSPPTTGRRSTASSRAS